MSETLLQLQTVQVEILDEFKKVCEKHHLRYYLFFGTLLGAVRHKGFIPWDDDVDVAMPREDYDRFIRIAKNELAENYYLESAETIDDCTLRWAKVRKKNTLYVMNPISYNKRPENERPLGIFIDVFPLDRTTDKSFRGADWRMRLCGLISGHLYHHRVNDIPHQQVSLKMKTINGILQLFTVKQLKSMMKRLMLGSGNRYVVMAGGDTIEHLVYPVECFEPAAQLLFGSSRYAVPKDYDRLLRIMYGDDYMELPPVEKRITHHPIKLSFDLEKEYVVE